MRVLLVDDLPTQRFILASLLSQFDCDVHIATGGPEALTMASETAPDVVLLDICMPEMDGYELASRIRKETALTDARIVAVSAWDCDAAKLAEVGIDRYVRKPVSLAALRTALEH